jgi:steroid 5-alpha reductase family enzyme
MSPLHSAALACATAAAICWILSVVTREYSWVDRIWSIMPPIYVGFYAYTTGFADRRLVCMAVLTALWGARLTFNFARKGGYARGGEDYRWLELRRRMRPWQYQVFNVFFIAGFQNALLFALALPAWVAREHRGVAFGAADVAAALLLLALLAGETIADEEQWRFQCDKKARKARGEPIQQEFLTTGLFRFSRHPNFFCEISQWWVLYAFSVIASGEWLNVSIPGPVVLTALFLGSTRFTEELSLAKYPAYAAYQQRVSQLIPWVPRSVGAAAPGSAAPPVSPP